MQPWRTKHGSVFAYPEFLPAKLTQSQWITDRSSEFIARHAGKIPFYLYCSFVAPHMPCVPTQEYLDRVPLSCMPEVLPTPRMNEIPPALARAISGSYPLARLSPAQWRSIRHYYIAYVAMIDDLIGKLLRRLEESGIADMTHVIFTSDHGDVLGDHGMWDKMGWHYDSCIRVPLIISGPNIRAGNCDALVSNLDEQLGFFPNKG